MSKFLLTVFASIFALSACTSAVPPEDAHPPIEIYDSALLDRSNGDSAIVVTRDSGIVGSACSFHVSVDGREVARLNPGEGFTAYVPAGQHKIEAAGSSMCFGFGSADYFDAVTRNGYAYRLRIFQNLGGDNFLRADGETKIE